MRPLSHLFTADRSHHHYRRKPPEVREVSPSRRAPPHRSALGPALKYRHGRGLPLADPLVGQVAQADADELAQQLADLAEVGARLQVLHQVEHINPAP